MKVLIIEDDQGLRQGIAFSLAQEGYEVLQAQNGKEGYRLFLQEAPQGILLDLNLPDMDGNDLCRKIRESSQVPILMVTALDGEEHQLRGFGMDIDDYVTKPFSMPVLLEKIRVILKRSSGPGGEHRLNYQDLTMDPDSREAVLDGQVLDLTAREFELLYTLLSSPGRVFTREMLLARLWGWNYYGDERIVDSHIKNLRRKLQRDYIETVRGIGYRAAKKTS